MVMAPRRRRTLRSFELSIEIVPAIAACHGFFQLSSTLSAGAAARRLVGSRSGPGSRRLAIVDRPPKDFGAAFWQIEPCQIELG
jgi:hypothetical protein